ncbi:hypothetical protein AMATHDRAFT_148211 [Amanita thiersii Skay4041]|uniref:FAD dependent oxidoreductase domain-containing protein n=1 Tax=Amanita thiersii Skay4041 TaxID=703135 RepID=A0A2A9NNA3_9AGAR|nr:hypothetical protein AMATHDRAFT_148211 [Amanita thiersii Skay4041]
MLEVSSGFLQSSFSSPLSQRASLPVPNATSSFWIDSPDANPLADVGSTGPLTTDADVCIIGSGITGVSTAYRLSQISEDPLSVIVVEARKFCKSTLDFYLDADSTRRNGGHLVANIFSGFRSRQSQYGLDDALKSYHLEQHTISSILSFVNSHNLSESVDLVDGGHIGLLLTPTEELHARADWNAAVKANWEPAKNSEKTKWLSAQEMNEKHGTPYPAFQTPGYNLWPLKLVTHLFIEASSFPSFNLTLHTHTPVSSITRSSRIPSSRPRRWTLHTPRGQIQCSSILHATNAYASHLLPSLSSTIIPTRGQVVAIDLPTSNTITPSFPLAGSWGANEGYEYWFPRPPQSNSNTTTVILGGGRETARPAFEAHQTDDSTINTRVSETLHAFLPRIFSGIPIEITTLMEWTGIMGFTTTGDPIVGPIVDNDENSHNGQYISAGYTGHGMPLAYGCAQAVADMILAELQGKRWKMPAWFPRHYLARRLQ